MTQTEIEERLIALEAEIRLLKGQLAHANGATGSVSNNSKAASPNKADPKWVLTHAGRFADDPGFAEVVRLGREYRESLRPKEKKAKKAKKGFRKVKVADPSYLTGKDTQKKPIAIQKPKSAVKYGGTRYGRPHSSSAPTE